MMERPSDMLDVAAELTQLEIESKLAEHKHRAKQQELIHKGFCYYCREPQPKLNFCDEDCRDDYEFEMKRRKANGI